MLCIESEDKKRVAYSFQVKKLKSFAAIRGIFWGVFISWLESQLFDECMMVVRLIEWHLSRGRQCSKMRLMSFWERTLDYLYLLQDDRFISRSHQWTRSLRQSFCWESCLKLIVCKGKSIPFMPIVVRNTACWSLEWAIPNLIPMLKKYSKRFKR